jgi:hypothetical protein
MTGLGWKVTNHWRSKIGLLDDPFRRTSLDRPKIIQQILQLLIGFNNEIMNTREVLSSAPEWDSVGSNRLRLGTWRLRTTSMVPLVSRKIPFLSYAHRVPKVLGKILARVIVDLFNRSRFQMLVYRIVNTSVELEEEYPEVWKRTYSRHSV